MNEKNTKHILSIMVDNEPGVLARVVGLFSGRGYNIESLSVSEVDSHKFLSRITIVTSGTKLIIDQIKAQLKKLIPVHNLEEISELKKFIGKELILIKLNVSKKSNIDIKRKLEKFGGEVLFDEGVELIIQFAGTPDEITKLLNLLKSYKIIEQTRSGLVSMALGLDYIRK
ncbi:MAG: acetolactate synthase small subunit [Rickettsiales bacterium]|nr:acetolactate synthase small subunit [Rickettsiales bacterium]|tara:strand:- start:2863 stop:3375 length:513 start_codon:yes stop_codon:yes gene_type:complete